jgi:hypothetical protein
MAESVPVDNEMLHQLPRPVREHILDNNPQSSPPMTPAPAAHNLPDPAQGAKGSVQ